MHLQAFHQDPHATPDALQFPGYLLQLEKRKLQSDEYQPIQILASVNLVTEKEKLVHQFFPNLASSFRNEERTAK